MNTTISLVNFDIAMNYRPTLIEACVPGGIVVAVTCFGSRYLAVN